MRRSHMDPLQLVRLLPLMSRSEGRRDVAVALIDGPVALDHPDLVHSSITTTSDEIRGRCSTAGSVACEHGTFVAGLLAARRGSRAPAICPGCTFILRPIFTDSPTGSNMPRATPEELRTAIIDAVNAGAKVINLSAAMAQPSSRDEQA